MVLTSDQFYILVFHAGGIWILLEVVFGYFVARVLLEQCVGRIGIFGGTGDMLHPVVWTWCVIDSLFCFIADSALFRRVDPFDVCLIAGSALFRRFDLYDFDVAIYCKATRKPKFL